MRNDRGPDADAYVLRLPHRPDAAALARDFVNRHTADLPGDLAADAQLLVSEIVTNAVRHGLPEIVLSVRLDPPWLGVAVSDQGGGGDVQVEHPDGDRTSGRGLLIVETLSSEWGVIRTDPPPGKTVWFELRKTTSQLAGGKPE